MDAGCHRIAHTLLLRLHAVPVDRFLTVLPAAFAAVVNAHPRMRARVPDPSSLSAEIAPLFSAADAAPLITVTLVGEDAVQPAGSLAGSHANLEGAWIAAVEASCNATVDRATQFPNFLRVFAHPAERRVRIVAFADHFMADGISGFVVLNDLLRAATVLLATNPPPTSTQEKDYDVRATPPIDLHPLRPPLMELLRPPRWHHPYTDRVLLAALGPLVESAFSSFKGLLPAGPAQRDFALPAPPGAHPQNPSAPIFRNGDPANLAKALAKCKSNNTTLHGAVLLCVAAAFARLVRGPEVLQPYPAAAAAGAQQKPDRFKVHIDNDYNMRPRLPASAATAKITERPVGLYMNFATLDWFKDTGVDLDAQFWPQARHAKKLTDAAPANRFVFTAPVLYVHHRLNAATKASPLKAPHAAVADLNLSNLGRYPFPLVHAVAAAKSAGGGQETTAERGNENVKEEGGGGEGDGEDAGLEIESLHTYNSLPNLAPAAVFYLTTLRQVHYSMMYKIEAPHARALFDLLCRAVEAVGDVEDGETVRQFAKRAFAGVDVEAVLKEV
ncbi:hypothetical protein DFJ73DRAFT_759949 [Zopfochytrium polystomum]|nr:hypothetical protein DFJ73DRAFT_759949 [Zopfochytrium polystomum]